MASRYSSCFFTMLSPTNYSRTNTIDHVREDNIRGMNSTASGILFTNNHDNCVTDVDERSSFFVSCIARFHVSMSFPDAVFCTCGVLVFLVLNQS